MTPRLVDTPVLETERLRLRAPEGVDAASWAAMAVTDRARYIGGPLSLPLAYRAWGHVIGHWCMYGCGSFVLERKSDGHVIGHVGPWTPQGWPERELGWVIWDVDAEGMGYAFEAVTAARSHAFHDLGWETAVSYIDADNTRSIALAERLGAKRDETAARPDNDWPAVLVYRHSVPEIAA